jgi:hypothetical protein
MWRILSVYEALKQDHVRTKNDLLVQVIRLRDRSSSLWLHQQEPFVHRGDAGHIRRFHWSQFSRFADVR